MLAMYYMHEPDDELSLVVVEERTDCCKCFLLECSEWLINSYRIVIQKINDVNEFQTLKARLQEINYEANNFRIKDKKSYIREPKIRCYKIECDGEELKVGLISQSIVSFEQMIDHGMDFKELIFQEVDSIDD